MADQITIQIAKLELLIQMGQGFHVKGGMHLCYSSTSYKVLEVGLLRYMFPSMKLWTLLWITQSR